MLETPREPTPGHQSRQLQHVEPGVWPDVLRLDDKTLPDRLAIEPDIRQTVDLTLDARDEAAAEAERTMELARRP
jgi:hypothetical protein